MKFDERTEIAAFRLDSVLVFAFVWLVAKKPKTHKRLGALHGPGNATGDGLSFARGSLYWKAGRQTP